MINNNSWIEEKLHPSNFPSAKIVEPFCPLPLPRPSYGTYRSLADNNVHGQKAPRYIRGCSGCTRHQRVLIVSVERNNPRSLTFTIHSSSMNEAGRYSMSYNLLTKSMVKNFISRLKKKWYSKLRVVIKDQQQYCFSQGSTLKNS